VKDYILPVNFSNHNRLSIATLEHWSHLWSMYANQCVNII